MKILNLVLYSKEKFYDDMLLILSKYYSQFSYVNTYFFMSEPNITEDYIIKEHNILILKGSQETTIPGILQKTVTAFDLFLSNKIVNDYKEYDYIIRTTVATVINFDLLKNELLRNPISFIATGLLHNLTWVNPDDISYGVYFTSGTSIILTKGAVKFIANNRDKLRYDLYDDVSICMLIKEYNNNNYPPVSISNNNKFVFMTSLDVSEIEQICKQQYIFYRNKTDNRQNDVKRIQIITDHLSKS